MTPDWLAQAAAVPVAFAQVREDPRVDLAVLEMLGRGGDLDGLMVASGGCTAAVLVASGRFRRLELVDANRAQLSLAELKLNLLWKVTPDDRLGICGHAPMSDREAVLTHYWPHKPWLDLLTTLPRVADLGLDHCGRYELLFAELRRAMGPVAEAMPTLLAGSDAAARLAPGTIPGDAMDRAFDEVMALPNLVTLFGEAATQNRVEPFARHFARRVRVALSTLSTADNPFLWQLLVGRFTPGSAYDWFNAEIRPDMWLFPPVETKYTLGTVDHALAPHTADLDFVHLSNVLDWLTPPQAKHTLSCAADALRSGGLVVIRQLNSTLELAELGPDFDWLDTAALHAADRSFFYRRLYLGRRR